VTIIGEEKEREYTPYNPPNGDDAPRVNYTEDISANDNERVNYNGLMHTFNTMFDGKLPLISAMTEKRKKAVKARVSEHGKLSIMTVLQNVENSKFLLGHNDNNWRCDFDWIFRPTNYVKILEGNYNGTRLNKNQQDSEQRKRDSVFAIATTVREAAEKKRKELETEGVIE